MSNRARSKFTTQMQFMDWQCHFATYEIYAPKDLQDRANKEKITRI